MEMMLILKNKDAQQEPIFSNLDDNTFQWLKLLLHLLDLHIKKDEEEK